MKKKADERVNPINSSVIREGNRIESENQAGNVYFVTGTPSVIFRGLRDFDPAIQVLLRVGFVCCLLLRSSRICHLKRAELLAVHDDATTMRRLISPSPATRTDGPSRHQQPVRRVSIVFLVVDVVLIDYGETVLVARR